MKSIHLTLILSAALLAAGCAETHKLMLDPTPRPPTAMVEVFKDGTQPTRSIKQIAELSYKGKAADELKAQEYLMRESEKLGANAILFSRAPSGSHLSFGMWGGLGGATQDVEYLFKAKALVYE